MLITRHNSFWTNWWLRIVWHHVRPIRQGLRGGKDVD